MPDTVNQAVTEYRDKDGNPITEAEYQRLQDPQPAAVEQAMEDEPC